MAAKLVVLLVFVLIASKLFEGIGGLASSASTQPLAVVGFSSPANNQPAQQAPVSPASQTHRQRVQTEQVARKRQKQINDQLAWKSSLMCGYSTDTMRCACYDPKGARVELEFEECKALADK